MVQKNIKIEEGEFQIRYVEELIFDEEYYKDFETSFVKILFIPNKPFSEKKAFDIIEPYELMLLSEIKEIIANHQEVYKYFDYDLYFKHKGLTMYKNLISRELLVVDVELSIDMKLKENL